MAGEEELRSEAAAAFEAALAAVDPARLIAGVRLGPGREAIVAGLEVPRPPGRRVVAAIGKAAPGLAWAWLENLPGWATECFVLAPHGTPLPCGLAARATVRRGAHPVPDRAGAEAARELLALAASLGPRDALVVLLSGGSSALLAAPVSGVALEDLITTTSALLAAGAPIGDLNTVRRELLAAAGGGLARAAAPASVTTLIVSDVVAGELGDVGSGPTLESPTGPGDAAAVLSRWRVAASPAVRAGLDRSGPSTAHPTVPTPSVAVLADNRTAVAAAAARLRRSGFETVVLARPVLGEAAVRGRQLGALAAALEPAGPIAIVAGGETTVTVRGAGRGGRCHELALAAAIELAGRSCRVLLAAGTDGVDGSTGRAGAVVDGGSSARVAAAGLDPGRALLANDSGSALLASGDALATGPTGTNVADLVLVLATPQPPPRIARKPR